MREILTWQTDEARRGKSLAALLAAIEIPGPGSVPSPPKVAEVGPTVQEIHSYRVILECLRPGGDPLPETRLSRAITEVTPAPSERKIQANELQLDFKTKVEGLSLRLAPEWLSPDPKPTKLAWAQSVDTRQELPGQPQKAPTPAAPLVLELPAATPAAKPATCPGSKDFPRLSKPLENSALALKEVKKGFDLAMDRMRRFTDHSVTIRPTGAEPDRQAAGKQLMECWNRLERIAGQLAVARDGLRRLTASENGSGRAALLGKRYLPLGAASQKRLLTAETATQHYRGLVLWWLAELRNPEQPDRSGAIAVLDPERKGPAAQPAGTLIARFYQVAAEENDAIRHLRHILNPPPIRRVTIRHDVHQKFHLRRTVAEVLVRGAEKADQIYLVNGKDERLIPFHEHPDGRIFRIPVSEHDAETGNAIRDPRPDLPRGSRLMLRRASNFSTLQSEIEKPAVPYPYSDVPTSVQVDPHTLQLSALRPAALAQLPKLPAEAHTRLQEIKKHRDHPLNLLRTEALRGKKPSLEPEGVWWLNAAGPALRGVRWCLRPLPMAVKGKSVELDHMAFVEAVQFTDPEVGRVGSIRVGSRLEVVQRELGRPDSPSTGASQVLTYFYGGLRIAVEAGVVKSLEFRRPIATLVGVAPGFPPPLTVVGIDRATGQIRLKADPHKLPVKYQRYRLEIAAPSSTRSASGTPEELIALFVDQTGEAAAKGEIPCYVMTVKKNGKLEPARAEVLLSLPAPETWALRASIQ